jgi:hypothetical protein
MGFWNRKRKRGNFESFDSNENKVTRKELERALDTLDQYSKQQEHVKNGDSFMYMRFEENNKGIYPKNFVSKGTSPGISQMIFTSAKKDIEIANIVSAVYGAMKSSGNSRLEQVTNKVDSLMSSDKNPFKRSQSIPDNIDIESLKRAVSEETGANIDDIKIAGLTSSDDLEKMSDQEMDDFLDQVARKTGRGNKRRRLDDDEERSE